MATYENGRVPRSALVTLDTGNGRHLTTVKCMVIWYALRAWVWATYQVWLEISPGMNAYRDYDEQGVGRRQACDQGNCNGAAAPGWSSHGGNWAHPVHTRGRRVDAMAFDIGNWWLLSKDAWFDACRRFGVEPGLIDRSVAGVDEWWHVIIFEPFGPAPPVRIHERHPAAHPEGGQHVRSDPLQGHHRPHSGSHRPGRPRLLRRDDQHGQRRHRAQRVLRRGRARRAH